MQPGDSAGRSILQLRVVLRHISPLIWRRLLVCRDTNIAQLHCILQEAFGWEDLHLHRFDKLVSEREVGSENLLINIAREQFAKENPKALKAVFDALQESAAQSAGDPAATAALWQKLGNLDAQTAPNFVPPSSREVHAVTPAILPTLQSAAKLFVKYRVIPSEPDFKPFILDVSAIP